MKSPVHDLVMLDAQIEQAKQNIIDLQLRRDELARFLKQSEKSAKIAIKESMRR